MPSTEDRWSRDVNDVRKRFFVTVRRNGLAMASLSARIKEELAFVRGNYAILVLSWLIMDFAMEVPATYYALYVIGLGATETIVGIIGLCYFLALASMQFPGGYIADRFGRKWIICTMTFGVALSYLFYALAPSWLFILLGGVLAAVFNSTYQPALMAMIADSLPPEKRGIGFGIISLISNVSTTPAPIVAAYLCSTFGLMSGMRISYGLVVALFLVAAILRTLYLKETIRVFEKPSLADLWRSYPTAVRESLTVFRRTSRSLIFLILAAVIGGFSFSTVFPYLPVYAIRELLIDEALWGIMLAAVPATTVVLSIPIGKLMDKVGRKVPLMMAYVLLAISAWLFADGGTSLTIVSLIFMGAGSVTIHTGLGSLIADLTPMSDRGKVNASLNFASLTFIALGNLVGGFLYEHLSPRSPFYLVTFVSLLAVLLIALFVKEAERMGN